MRLQIIKQYLSTRLKRARGFLWRKSRRGRKTFTQREELFLSCNELPFDRFIKCSVKGDYEQLIRPGAKKQYQLPDLLELWANIQLEFIDLIEEQETLYLLKLEQQMLILHHQIVTTETTCYMLEMIYNEDLVNCLHELGYNYDFSPTDFKKNTNSLGAINNRLAPLRLQLEMKKIEYEELTKNKSDGERPTEKFYSKMLTRLAKFMGVHVLRAKDITTAEYCSIFREYVEDINEQKKLAEKHGSKRHY